MDHQSKGKRHAKLKLTGVSLVKIWQHYAFDASGHKGHILKAFDINTTANEVYAHNHGKKQLAQVLSPPIILCSYDP